MSALQRTTQKCHIPKVSENRRWYKERASSSVVHQCAYMWLLMSVQPSRGQCYTSHCITHSWGGLGPHLPAFFKAPYILHYNWIQERFAEKKKKKKWNHRCAAFISCSYRNSSSLTYRISLAELGTWLTPPTTRRRSLMMMEEVEHRGKFMGANLSHFFFCG